MANGPDLTGRAGAGSYYSGPACGHARARERRRDRGISAPGGRVDAGPPRGLHC